MHTAPDAPRKLIRQRFERPLPPPPGTAWTGLAGVAGLLGISLRLLAELRSDDPTFPAGRLLGARGGTLRFNVPAVLAWVDRQPEARWSTVGSGRRFRKDAAQ